jgi:hypothetical protein
VCAADKNFSAWWRCGTMEDQPDGDKVEVCASIPFDGAVSRRDTASSTTLSSF